MWYDAGEGMSASDSETAAEIVPFPAARRAGHVRSMARLLLSYSPEGAERTLAANLTRQRATLLRHGLAPEVVDREIRALELAIRTRLWVIVMQGGDAA
jgi:Family of unknown function (DUF6074)